MVTTFSWTCMLLCAPDLPATYHHHHHYYYFWLAPLWVHSAIRNQQPPERVILSLTDCFSQCELYDSRSFRTVFHPCDLRATGWSLPILWWERSQDLLSISTVIQSCNVPKQRETPCDIWCYMNMFWLFGIIGCYWQFSWQSHSSYWRIWWMMCNWCDCNWLETSVNFGGGWRCPVNDIQWSQCSHESSVESKQQPSGRQGDVVLWQH